MVQIVLSNLEMIDIAREFYRPKNTTPVPDEIVNKINQQSTIFDQGMMREYVNLKIYTWIAFEDQTEGGDESDGCVFRTLTNHTKIFSKRNIIEFRNNKTI